MPVYMATKMCAGRFVFPFAAMSLKEAFVTINSFQGVCSTARVDQALGFSPEERANSEPYLQYLDVLDIPTVTGEIQSPLAVASVEFVDPREPVAIIPILRAGLALAEHASSILPATRTYHLGVSRDEETLQPSVYLNKLPDKFPEGSRVFVVDPMLAAACSPVCCGTKSADFDITDSGTSKGGTIVAAIDLIKDRGVDNKQIKVVSAVAAPPALQKLSEKFPGLLAYAGIIDPTVNEKGFILPGLGDAGDRSFGT
ncbi:hypothetical protein RJ639_018677 [Escallonia herrerae]|uniref:uracil phosphoribosyltransferase n=1 Tax=Escallonia herrerae TaxID=1293975 RepID=A0AA89AJ51_9ASTE|nr:hypothetical protein RJ639_018677 [Escallonia herrerae]